LIKVLESLKEQGNTVVIVEHEEEIMRAADYIIDIGPLAGYLGGEVVFEGDFKEMLKKGKSLTAQYLNNELEIALPKRRRKSPNFIQIQHASLHNLKNITTRIPLNSLVTITGVSGSGKSTLIKEFLYPGLKQVLYDPKQKLYKGATLSGDTHLIKEVIFIDQNPIGKSSRSNPITYLKAFDDIREIFAKQPIAKMRNYKPGFFSFNIDGGRCEVCEGEGIITVGMQFMADIQLTCETCQGKRYKTETLEVVYRDKNIAEILEMTIDEAYDFFSSATERLEQRVAGLLKPLLDVGLGYLKAGQASSTMSGGEAQRIKLASFLAKGNTQQPTLFIFDEPTTGLHFHDIDKLMHSFYALIHQGHSIVVIEHNIDVIKCADWIIDIGPDSGIDGGTVTFEGTPEDLVKMTHNHTATFLKPKLVSQ
jgi:excinuclease ABC subunit A